MKNNSYLEEWLSKTRYLYMDIFDDNFAINFEEVTNGELVEKGILEIPSDEVLEDLYDMPFQENKI